MITINKDFQGWPVYAKNLKEILLELGFEEKDGKMSISSDNELLQAYPRLLEDDGMAYGVNEQYITEVDSQDIYETKISYLDGEAKEEKLNDTISYPKIIKYKVGKENIKVFNIFRENPTNEKLVNVLNKELNDEN